MRHFATMALYAALVAIVFSFVSPAETKRARILAGLRVFGEFLGVGLLLAWVVYFLPW